MSGAGGAPRRVRCWSMGDRHSNPWVHCDLCGETSVFHWRNTYPDLLLCRDCLECYPEITDAPWYSTKHTTRQNERSWSGW